MFFDNINDFGANCKVHIGDKFDEHILQHSQYQEEMTELRNIIEREQEKALRLDLDRTQAMEGRLHVEKQLDNIQETLEQVCGCIRASDNYVL